MSDVISMKKVSTSHRLGVLILLVSLIGFIVYAYLLLLSNYDILVLKFTLLFFVAAIVGVIACMGYTMATAVSMESTEEGKTDMYYISSTIISPFRSRRPKLIGKSVALPLLLHARILCRVNIH